MLAAVGTLAAQDTTRVDQGVRVGVDYRPGVGPGMVVLPGPGSTRFAPLWGGTSITPTASRWSRWPILRPAPNRAGRRGRWADR